MQLPKDKTLPLRDTDNTNKEDGGPPQDTCRSPVRMPETHQRETQGGYIRLRVARNNSLLVSESVPSVFIRGEVLMIDSDYK